MVGELTWGKRIFGLWLPLAAFIAMGLLLVVRTAHNDQHRAKNPQRAP